MGLFRTTSQRDLAAALNPPGLAHKFVDCPTCEAVAGDPCVRGYRNPCPERSAAERREAINDALAKLAPGQP